MANQQDLEQIQILQSAERLVSTVVRAFFDDDCILVIDTLIREKYLKDKDDDLGARLGLQPKQVRAILARLEAEGLVKQEEMLDEFSGGRKANYWYVDYRHAVNMIRLRTYLMQRKLKDAEKAELARQTYVCPQCNATFGVLEIQKLVNGARGFCCSHCCEMDTHETCTRGPHSLADFDNGERLRTVTNALRELKEQLSASCEPGCARAGIYDLVKELHDKPVPSNLPSELRARGVGGGARSAHTAAKLARFRDERFSLHAGYAANAAAGRKNASDRGVDLLYARNAAGYEVVVEIESDSDDGGEEEVVAAAAGLAATSRRAAKRKADAAAAAAARAKKKALPTFLRGSRISGAGGEREEASTEQPPPAAAAEQVAEGGAAGAEQDEGDAKRAVYLEELAKQQARLAAEGGAGAGASAAAEIPTDTDDLIWVSADDDELGGWEGVHTGSGSSSAEAAGEGIGGAAEEYAGGMPPPAKRSGVVFEVEGRTVPLELLTAEQAAALSSEQYTQFYAATASLASLG